MRDNKKGSRNFPLSSLKKSEKPLNEEIASYLLFIFAAYYDKEKVNFIKIVPSIKFFMKANLYYVD